MEDCFHLGVKALIPNHEGKLLLLQREGKSWDIPGGRIHKNEPLEAALRREVFEETGLNNILRIEFFKLTLSSTRILIPSGNVGLVLAVYLCHCEDVSRIQISDEHVGFDWFEPSEAAEQLSAHFPSDLTILIKNLTSSSLV